MTKKVTQWVNNQRLEQELERQGVSWKIKKVKKEEIDFKSSKENHARLSDPIKDELVQRYQKEMNRGDKFPRCAFCTKKVDGKIVYVVKDGNHRTLAHFANGHAEIEVYVLETQNDKKLNYIMDSSNLTIGEPTPDQERLQKAVQATSNGYSVKQASELYTVSETAITRKKRANKMAEEIEGMGMDSSQCSDTILSELSRLPGNKNVLQKVVMLVKDVRLDGKRTAELVSEVIRERGGETSQLVIVEKFRKMWLPAGIAARVGIVHKKTHLQKFLSSLAQIKRLSTECRNLLHMGAEDHEEAGEVKERIRETIKALSGFLKASEEGSSPRVERQHVAYGSRNGGPRSELCE